ncbi:MAG TPA: winged helix-turn-helix domain-containing protein, partial [Bryobacteraceae bacterium]|nr:winged helix-turn-helix domain-containing protein [Bryobacteraceae bacterium]
MPDFGKGSYAFGPFRIDPVERLLYRGDEMIPLTPKVADTLLALVSNAGRVLEKDDLIKMIWPDSFVEEGGLARNISILRKVFEEGTEGGTQYIETIPKRGYRFVGLAADVPPVEPKPAVQPGAKRHNRWEWAIPVLLLVAALLIGYYRLRQPVRINSLVVLPLHNLANDAAFTDGMHEALINALAKIESLRVISQTSAMAYQGIKKPLPVIARELNVDAVVEGSVQQAGGRVRVNVQLFEARAERPLWANTYDSDLHDVLALQSQMAAGIAHEIQLTLTPREKERLADSRRVDPEAWLAYARGRFYWNKRSPESIQKGIEYFQNAIAKDPGYAAPYAGLADAYALLSSNGADALPPLKAMPLAKAAALKAVELDDRLAEGHTSLGYVRLSYDWNLAAAQREFQRATELNPGYATAHHWYAHYWLAMAEPEKA